MFSLASLVLSRAIQSLVMAAQASLLAVVSLPTATLCYPQMAISYPQLPCVIHSYSRAAFINNILFGRSSECCVSFTCPCLLLSNYSAACRWSRAYLSLKFVGGLLTHTVFWPYSASVAFSYGSLLAYMARACDRKRL